jgi:hypothetical protein
MQAVADTLFILNIPSRGPLLIYIPLPLSAHPNLVTQSFQKALICTSLNKLRMYMLDFLQVNLMQNTYTVAADIHCPPITFCSRHFL